MARRQRRIDEAKHEHWRGLLRQWRACGLGVRRFCEREGLRESQFWWWKRRLGEQVVKAPKKKAEAVFVPVSIVETSAIEIELRSGHKLHVRAGCARQLLSEVVAVLEDRPC
jgi:hypothetical protein